MPGRKPEIESEELRAKILKLARVHFAQHGYQGASLKKIAEDAGVAASLIHYHFDGKEDLFKACLELYSRDRYDAISRILSAVSSRDEMRVRLELFVEEMVTSIMADPNGFEIVEREMRSANPLVMEVYQNSLHKVFQHVVDFFTEAQKNGLLKKDLEPVIVAGLLFSSTCNTARKEVLAKRFFNVTFEDEKWRKKFGHQVVDVLMNGVMK